MREFESRRYETGPTSVFTALLGYDTAIAALFFLPIFLGRFGGCFSAGLNAMEIVHEYSKPRRDFGRQCLFSDHPAELVADVPPDPDLALQFMPRGSSGRTLQCSQDMSEHQVAFQLNHVYL